GCRGVRATRAIRGAGFRRDVRCRYRRVTIELGVGRSSRAVDVMESGGESVGAGSGTAAPARLHVCTLGPLHVVAGGSPLEVRRPAERLLLGLLAATPGAYLDAVELVEAGWPDA